MSTLRYSKVEKRPSLGERVRDFFGAFSDLFSLPAAFWIVIFVFVIESCAYFGILTLMTKFLGHDLGWGDQWAGPTVSVFTMLVTLFMLGAGSYAESFGLRRAIYAALFLCLAGRLVYCLVPGRDPSLIVVLILACLVVIALGEAILQPVCYSGIKQYTNEKTSSMGYGLIYAFMNAGIFLTGFLSSYVRPPVQDIIDARAAHTTTAPTIFAPMADFAISGVHAMNWICTGITALALIFFTLTMTRRREAEKIRPDPVEEMRKAETRSWDERLWSYFTEGPFANPRFVFFIFMLLPVRTLFAHQWLTLPDYITRAYSKAVADKMDIIAESLNPAIIFLGVPIFTALTRRINIYTMMIIGTLVSAAPTFMLCAGPNFYLLIAYITFFSIGEALWSARFLEYASELAPEGRVAQYMGLANIPWLLAKGTTGFYSGVLLSKFCPENAPPSQLHTETLWLIYGCIAMLTPIGLILARRWVMQGLHAKPAEPVTANSV